MNQYLGCPILDNLIAVHPNKDMVRYAGEAVRFRIDNVGAYWDEHAGAKRIQDLIINAAPLADSCWFECSYPDKVSMGVLVVVLADRHVLPEAFVLGDQDISGNPRVRWLLGCWLSVQGKLDGFAGVIGHVPVGLAVSVEDDGVPYNVWSLGQPPELRLTDKDVDLLEKYGKASDVMRPSGMLQHIGPALLAVCFSHCRNVVRREIHPSRQVKRQLERGGKPQTTYKVLDIDPAKRLLQTEGNIAENGLQKALHIVKGHFARYTPERPLFGKYVGTFYHPVHTRGSLDKGKVVKGYNVKAPKEEVNA